MYIGRFYMVLSFYVIFQKTSKHRYMNMHEPGLPVTHGIITAYPLSWHSKHKGSTHELVIKADHIYITGQDMDKVARFNTKTETFEYFSMASGILKPEVKKGNGPHGLLLDGEENVWVSLEFKGTVARLGDDGSIVEEIDVKMYVKDVKGANIPINTAPHGICLSADKKTIWFTGKRTSTVGKINLGTKIVEHFQLEQLAALPIFLSAGPENSIWGTELFQSHILHISQSGDLNEYKIPTANSRPIAIIPDPGGKHMWFTEEAGAKIGRIDMEGHIAEFAVPTLQKNDILGSLVFDREYNLWVQVYADSHNPLAPEYNAANYAYIIKMDRSIRDLQTGDISGISCTVHTLPPGEMKMDIPTGEMKMTPDKMNMPMLHRIKMAADGNLWFTEMMGDMLCKITIGT